MHDGQLAERVVTESHQFIELAQIEAEIKSRQEDLDTIMAEIQAEEKQHDERMSELLAQRTKAEAALEDCKSDLSRGEELVAVQPVPGPEESPEDGASELATDNLAQPGPEF